MILPFTLKPLRKLADEELMARARNGSDEAFEEIYRRYARRLTGFFVRQLHGDSDTAHYEEIVISCREIKNGPVSYTNDWA